MSPSLLFHVQEWIKQSVKRTLSKDIGMGYKIFSFDDCIKTSKIISQCLPKII